MFVYCLYCVLYLLPTFKVKALQIIDMKVLIFFSSSLYQVISIGHDITFLKQFFFFDN